MPPREEKVIALMGAVWEERVERRVVGRTAEVFMLSWCWGTAWSWSSTEVVVMEERDWFGAG